MQTYDDWKIWAQERDTKSGAVDWKNEEKSGAYDYKVIRKRYEELREIRASKDAKRLLYYFKEGVHGNMAGMGAPKLYTQSHFGTKTQVQDYIAEVVDALKSLSEVSSKKISKQERQTLLRRIGMGFGRSALMLSGAGSMGAFHLGVVKSLSEQVLLPRVISGASTGAIVTAILGTRSAEARAELLADPELPNLMRFHMPERGRRNVDLYDVEELLRNLVPDLTFEEAYAESGLHINISVAPKNIQQRSRLLNATTAPNAYIREAVLATCAIPGLFPPVTLAAKDENGDRQSYIPSRAWMDGSVTDELPSKRLARLYGINHFISSSANPMSMSTVMPDIPIVSQMFDIQQSITRQWLKLVYPSILNSVQDRYPLNVMARNWFSSVTQEYKADIEIKPRSRTPLPGTFFETLTLAETEELFLQGQNASWPKLEQIRITTAISRCIDELLLEMGEDSLVP